MKENLIKEYQTAENILSDLQLIIETSQTHAYQAVNETLVKRNWLIGYRIHIEEMKEENRAEYGMQIIQNMAKELTKLYGRGFAKSNLYSFYNFYKYYPNIFQSVIGKSQKQLSRSHYSCLIQVKDYSARDWYTKEAAEQSWSVRTLQRNISSQYFYRLLKSQNKDAVIDEMKAKTSIYQNDKLEFIKNPIIAEFLGMSSDHSFTESELEKSILENLQKFLMELGKGYAFVAKQQHI